MMETICVARKNHHFEFKWKVVFLGLLVGALNLILSGCATGVSTGSIPPLNPSETRLIIYRPSEIVWAIQTPTVNINGLPTCGISNGSSFQKDVMPGLVTISAQIWDSLGTSHLSFNARADQVYYVRIKPNNGQVWSGMALGVIGQGIDESVSKHSGPFDIDLTERGGNSPGICAN